jgi:hypothetical protein
MLQKITIAGWGLTAVLAAESLAWAHPGHGVIPPDEPAHWLEPVHALPVIILGFIVAAVAWRRSRHNA